MLKDLIELLKQFNISQLTITILLALGFVGSLFLSLIKLIQFIFLKNYQWRLNESLRPYFSERDVDKATRYYIPTKYQNVSPSADEEPGKSHIASAKNELIPLFIKKAFKNEQQSNKYYLILADTGMGKTTFLINLFLKYKVRPIRNLLGLNENQKMFLFPLGSPDIWSDIEKIEDKRNTILLLVLCKQSFCK